MGINFLRLDRLATLYMSYPLYKFMLKNRKFHIPILMYHSISSIPDKVFHPYFQTNTDPGTFFRQMEWLANNNYRTIPLNMLEEEIKYPIHDRNKPFVITFDDGFKDFLENAFPILNLFNFTATVFLPTGFIGQRWMGKDCLTWKEVRALQSEGIEFGSHTVSHPKLHRLSHKLLHQEIENSKKAIEHATGQKVVTFSYPYAFPQEDLAFIEVIGRILSDQGYTLGVSTRIGRVSVLDDMRFLKRIPINMNDDSILLRAKMEGGYDWVYNVQYLSRILKKWV